MTNLKRIIDEKGVKQRWLAEAVGVTEVSMSRYVSGERIPKAPIAIRMADALGVNVKDLYGWESEKRTEERTETHACDLIDREAAVDAIYHHLPSVSRTRARTMLHEVPSVQPERMRGKWIERNPQNSDKCRLIECDQCGFSHIVGFNVPYEHWIENRNFCERCGADMRGEQDG